VKDSSPVQACAVIADSSVESYRASLIEGQVLSTSQHHLLIAQRSVLLNALRVAEEMLTSEEATHLTCDLVMAVMSKLKDISSPRTEISSSKSLSATPPSNSDSSFRETTSTARHVLVTASGLDPWAVRRLRDTCQSIGAPWEMKTNAKK
jgi:hypothetical protein